MWHCQHITVLRLHSFSRLRLLALLLPLPTQSRSTVVPVTSRSGVLKAWTRLYVRMQICSEFKLSFYVVVCFFFSTRTSTRTCIGICFNFFYSYQYSYRNDQFFISIVWRVTGQSPSQYVQPAGWSESSYHSLHAAGSFDRGYCSERKEISWSQFAPKSLVLRVHF